MNLQDLKKLSDEELNSRWNEGQFPFDFALCGRCMTQHGSLGCIRADHTEFFRQANEIRSRLRDYSGSEFRRLLNEIYALRLFFKDFYPHTPEVEEPQPIEEAVEAT